MMTVITISDEEQKGRARKRKNTLWWEILRSRSGELLSWCCQLRGWLLSLGCYGRLGDYGLRFWELRNGGKLGLGPGLNLIRPFYYFSGRIVNKQFYGDYSFWIRCPSKPLKLIIVPDSPSLPFDPSNLFYFPILAKVIFMRLHQCSWQPSTCIWLRLVSYLSITCWWGGWGYSREM